MAKRGTLARLTAENQKYPVGLAIFVQDLGAWKLGDGVRNFVDLPWMRVNQDPVVATSQVAQVGITGFVDVTGIITFTVDESGPWVVEAEHPYIVAVTAAVVPWLQISDQNGVNKSRRYGLSIPLGLVVAMTAQERITVPGTYQRKLQVGRGSGTGTITSLADNPTSTAIIRAYPEK